jgi:hypothetical protein
MVHPHICLGLAYGSRVLWNAPKTQSRHLFPRYYYLIDFLLIKKKKRHKTLCLGHLQNQSKTILIFDTTHLDSFNMSSCWYHG